MADFLEDVDSPDADRNIDQCSFHASQFEIFTHDFRENGETSCSGEDGDHSKCKHADEEARKSKKEVVNVTRKLQKALVFLEMVNTNGSISDLLVAMKDINSQLRDAILKDNAEFSSTTVTLPDYDVADMQLLLGEKEVLNQKSMLERVKEEQERSKNELNCIIAQANILLQEYDHIKNGIPNRL